MTPDEEIDALRSCVRMLWRGMKPAQVKERTYWTENGLTWPHIGVMTITPEEITAISRAFNGLPRDIWPYNELTQRGIPKDHTQPANPRHR